MITVRPAGARGRTSTEWLDSRHTFSFADYYDPAHMGFRALRVLNDDRVGAGAGFGAHPHRDMEILSLVLEGALEHRDSLGTGSVLRPGDVQRMSAGTGVRHSEWNPSETEPVHFLQVWIAPERSGLPPGYEQRRFEPEDLRDRWKLIASREGRDGSLTVHQDVALWAARLAAGARVRHELRPGRHAWIQVASGSLELNGVALGPGDGAAVSEETSLLVHASEETLALLFDLP